MIKPYPFWITFIIGLIFLAPDAIAQQAGSIRGMVYDKDFEVPLPAAQVTIVETGEEVTCSDEGNYVFSQVEPGTYTVIVSKEGYTRQVEANVVVSPGRMTELDAWLTGDFAEMEEFIVQDIQIGTGTEAILLELRMESPAFMDSISADLMSQAGVSDAASALTLVSGATIQEGKYAVVRGLPDRYVNSQMNSVRLPTADADKRAVQLDQFPSAVIDSVQVTKTFTPDQQGDASGGAVNVKLKGIPEKTTFNASSQISWNSQVVDADNRFLTHKGGGVSCWGKDNRDYPIERMYYEEGELITEKNFDPVVGVSRGDAPTDHKWSLSGGGKHVFDDGLKIGGFGNFYYERDSSFYDNGIDDKYVVEGGIRPDNRTMVPKRELDDGESFQTALYDVTKGSEEVKWGGLGVFGVETENHSLNFLFMHTHDAEDTAVLAEDTRGKEYFFPGYNPYDPEDIGNDGDHRFTAPYNRLETINYTERTTQTLQFSGRHTLEEPDIKIENVVSLLSPEFDWLVAHSTAELYQPDKRMFGSYWVGASADGRPQEHREKKPGTNVNLGNLQRVWKDITEESNQYIVNLKFPFQQWTENEGYLKFGWFHDQVDRTYRQESASNIDRDDDSWEAPWGYYWSEVFSDQGNELFDSYYDVDYDGVQKISAWYWMADMPLCSYFTIIGGVRTEITELSIENDPDLNPDTFTTPVTWIDLNTGSPVMFTPASTNVAFEQTDQLPSIAFEWTPVEKIKFRGSYSETIARQTFKELSPIMQQEYLGGDVFIGNPELQMSHLDNYDLRFDYVPHQGGLISLSYFHKDVEDPIEYLQGHTGAFAYTYPENYPKGVIDGYEIEIRQEMGEVWKKLSGLALGTNATFIDSEVTLPKDEAQNLKEAGAPTSTRDMTNAPEYLYNLFATYDLERFGTKFGVFYTVRGDTLVAGAKGSSGGGEFIPSVYETEYGMLNFSLSQKLGEIWTLKFQAKNLLDPDIETVYRSDYIDNDVTKTSYKKGKEFSISLGATF